MSRLDRWLAREASWERKRPILEEALIGNRAGRYLWHRLRILGPVRILAWIIHLVEFLFLVRIFTSTDLSLSFGIRNLVLLIGSFWWGALEVLRSRLREHAPVPEDRIEVERWLTLASVPAAGILLLAVVGLAGIPIFQGRAPEILELYALVVLGRLAIDLVVRTFYSGVYARRRVYRPVTVILCLEILGLALILALWGRLQAWSFPLAMAIAAGANHGVVLYYTARAYRTLRIPVPRLGRMRSPRLTRQDIATMVMAGASNGLTRIGSALVLFLVLRGPAGGAVVGILHVLAPLLATAAAWPQIFYPDFKRLRFRLAWAVRRRFERSLVRATAVAGIFLASLGIGTVTALGADFTADLASVVPLFLVQACVGYLNLPYFAMDRFQNLLAGGLVVVIGIPLMVAQTAGDGSISMFKMLLGTSAILGVSGLTMLLWPFGKRTDRALEEGYFAWMTALARVHEPVRIGVVSMADARASTRNAILALVERSLDGNGRAIDIGHRIVWFDRGESGSVPTDAVLVSGGGLVVGVKVDAPIPSGREAAMMNTTDPWFGPRDRGLRGSLDRIIARFREDFPGGSISNLMTGACDGGIETLGPMERQEIWRCARLHALGKRPRERTPFDVHVVLERGEIRTLLLAPRTADEALRRQWTEFFRDRNRIRAIEFGAQPW